MTYSILWTCFFTRCLHTMQARLVSKQPFKSTIFRFMLIIGNNVPCMSIHLFMGLDGTSIILRYRWKIIPVFASYHTRTASITFGYINIFNIIWHVILGIDYTLLTSHKNALYSGIEEFGSPICGVKRLAVAPVAMPL